MCVKWLKSYPDIISLSLIFSSNLFKRPSEKLWPAVWGIWPCECTVKTGVGHSEANLLLLICKLVLLLPRAFANGSRWRPAHVCYRNTSSAARPKSHMSEGCPWAPGDLRGPPEPPATQGPFGAPKNSSAGNQECLYLTSVKYRCWNSCVQCLC